MLGGDTVFMKTAKAELCRVAPQRGMALLHAHGRRCLLHEGEEVRRGVKYLLRADIMYRRQPPALAAEEQMGTGGDGGGNSQSESSESPYTEEAVVKATVKSPGVSDSSSI